MPDSPKPKRTRKRSPKAEERRDAIVAAAIEEFAARGFGATRIDDIAARAGVAKGTIYLYFRDKVALFEGAPPDPRLAEAIEVVRAARQPDGTWLQGTPLSGRTWFDVDAAEGEPSRWLTLIGGRALAWWDAAR